MNTKFPLNGRYTMLGDLVHEYASISTWPKNIVPDDDIQQQPIHNHTEEGDLQIPDTPLVAGSSNVLYGEDSTGAGIPETNYWDIDKAQPFIRLVYDDGNSASATYPYELVWFDNVYSNNKKSSDNKMMKILQSGDASIYGFGREIRAKEISDAKKIRQQGIPFRFVIPNQTGSDRYFYNYKTSDGEAVVMYAIHNIIDSIVEYGKTINDAKLFLFGLNRENDIWDIGQSATHYFDLKIDTLIVTYIDQLGQNKEDTHLNINQTYTVTLTGNDVLKNTDPKLAKFFNSNRTELKTFTETGSDLGIIQEILENKNSKYKNCVIQTVSYGPEPSNHGYIKWYGKDKNGNEVLPTDNSLPVTCRVNIGTSLFKNDVSIGFVQNTSVGYDEDDKGIWNINDNYLDPRAYEKLGEVIWTKKYVQYKNYTTDKLPNDVPGEISDLKDIEDLKNTIFNFFDISSTYKDSYDNDKKYLSSSNIVNKIFYFCTLFLNSQRYYWSYITAFQFVKISSVSYAQNQPVLRCDLGIFQDIERFIIISATHVPSTALPQGPLDSRTFILINIKFKVKYKNIPRENESEFDLKVSFNDINNWTEAEDNSDNNDFGYWARLILPFDEEYTALPTISDEDTDPIPIDEDSVKIGIKYGDDFFKKVYTYDDETNQVMPKEGETDGSLGTIKWPLNDNKLRVYSLDKLEELTNNTDYIADTFNESTFRSSPSNFEKYVNEYMMPFGTLRLHNVYNQDTVTSTMNSSFYIDVSILRCKNFYYEAEQSIAGEESVVNLYYEPVYISGSPNTDIACIKKTEEDADNVDNNVETLNTWFNEANYDTPMAKYMMLSKASTTDYYLSIKTFSGAYTIFASGAREISKSSISQEEFVCSEDLIFWYLNKNTNEWVLDNKIVYTKHPAKGYGITKTENQYILNFNGVITWDAPIYFRMQIENIPNYYYFRLNPYRDIIHSVYIHPLFVADSIHSVQYSNEYNLTQNKNKNSIHLCLVLYNRDLTIDNNNLTYTSISFNTDFVEAKIQYNNLYIKPTSVKTILNDGFNTGNYIYTYNKPNCFNIAYQISKVDGRKPVSTYKFAQSDLFPQEGILLTDLMSSGPIPSIYVALEPIYIIEFGNLTKNTSQSIDLFRSVEIVNYVYKGLDGEEGTVGIQEGNTNINSFVTDDVYLNANSIKIDGLLLPDFITVNKNNYNFSFDIIYNIIDENGSPVSDETQSITITNNLLPSNINISNLKFEPNKHTLINLNVTELSQSEGGGGDSGEDPGGDPGGGGSDSESVTGPSKAGATNLPAPDENGYKLYLQSTNGYYYYGEYIYDLTFGPGAYHYSCSSILDIYSYLNDDFTDSDIISVSMPSDVYWCGIPNFYTGASDIIEIDIRVDKNNTGSPRSTIITIQQEGSNNIICIQVNQQA